MIKQINAASGAHCELDRRAQGSDRNNRTFYIRGHPEAVEHCKRIIMEKVGMVCIVLTILTILITIFNCISTSVAFIFNK